MATQVVKIRKNKTNSNDTIALRFTTTNRLTGETITSKEALKTVRVRNGNFYKALKELFNW